MTVCLHRTLGSRVVLRLGVEDGVVIDETGFSYSFGLILAHPVHPGWEYLPVKSNQPAKPLVKLPPTPSCTNADGTGSRKVCLACGAEGNTFTAPQNLSLASFFLSPRFLIFYM